MLKPLPDKDRSADLNMSSHNPDSEFVSGTLPPSPLGKQLQRDLSEPLHVESLLHQRLCSLEEQQSRLSPQSVLTKLHHCLEHIASHIRGFDTPILQTTLALMTANHHCIIGPTGVGKSYYARAILGVMGRDITTYRNQLTLETTEHELFGFIPMDRITDGSGCRNLSGSFVLADIALLDEVFDARDELLRSMLWPLSDRQYRNGNTCVPSTLHSVIACGNYARDNHKTAAFLDRFLFQTELSGVLSPVDRQRLLRDTASDREIPKLPQEECLSLAELLYLPRLVDGLLPRSSFPLPPDIRMLLDAIVTSYDAERSRRCVNNTQGISLRNLKQLGRVVTAHALTKGREVATLEDLSCLSLAIPVVGDKESCEVFGQAWRETMSYAHPGERNALRTLSELTDVVDLVAAGAHLRPLRISEQILTYLGITTERRISFGQLRKSIGSLTPSLPYAISYRNDLLSKIDDALDRTGKGIDDLIAFH